MNKFSNNAGVLWGTYNADYSKYECAFPTAFPWSRDTTASKVRYIKGEDGYWYDPDAVDNGRAVISCTGDLMCEPRMGKAYKFDDEYFFRPAFKYVKGVLKEADLVVGNLETTVTDITPYADEWHRIDGKYHCNAPESYLEALRYAGFDVLVNANNHNCDSAVTGLVDTLQALDRKNFMHTGTFYPDQTERNLYVKVNGIKLCILSYATYYNKLEVNFTKKGQNQLLNKFSPEKAAADVRAARKKGAEYVISYIHWGREYTHEVSDMQKKYAQELADAGVDAIVGSHSHSLQPTGSVVSRSGKQVPVVYSLGNFITNEAKQICKHTAIYQIVLEKHKDGVRLSGTYLVPCYVFNKYETSSFAPVPLDILLNGGAITPKMPEYDAYIRNVMKDVPVMQTASITFEEICEILGASMPAGVPNRQVSRICTNLETIVSGSIFMGIVWNSDQSLQKAITDGSLAVITNRKVEGIPCIVVKDTCEAYCKLLGHIRNRFPAKAIGITGSVGKTTTKEIMDCVISGSFNTLASPGNWNTRHYGALVMQQLRPYHEYYIQEIHEGDPRSAEMVSRFLQPEYCVITNMGIAHRESFKDDAAFAKGFLDITAGLRDGGALVVNADDALLMEHVSKMEKKFRIITFGMDESADYRITAVESDGENVVCRVEHNGEEAAMRLDSPFETNAYNMAAVYAVAREIGIDKKKIAESMLSYKSNGIRANLTEYKGLKLLLDCRSATPVSVASAIETLSNLPMEAGGRRIALLGDMHIDEAEIEKEYRKIGELTASKNFDYLYCFGPNSHYFHSGAIDAGFSRSRAFCFTDKRELEVHLCALLKPGDALMIKAGRRMYLNTTIRKLFKLRYTID